jgi:hypothetical protein
VACITKLILIIKQISRRKKQELFGASHMWYFYCCHIWMMVIQSLQTHQSIQNIITNINTKWRWLWNVCMWRIQRHVWIKMVSLWRISNDDLATTDHTLLEKGKHEAWRPRMFVMEKSKWILESDGSRWPWRITYTSKYQLFMNQKHEMIWIESGFLIIWSENS